MRESEDYFGVGNKYVIELQPTDFDPVAPWKIKSKNSNLKDSEGSTNPRQTHSATGLVLFYAPWCPHCKMVKDIWEKAAKTVGFCDFYAFNCEKHKGHMSKISSDMPKLVNTFPTIITYKNGKPDEYYKGERTEQAFINECMNLCGKGGCRKDSK